MQCVFAQHETPEFRTEIQAWTPEAVKLNPWFRPTRVVGVLATPCNGGSWLTQMALPQLLHLIRFTCAEESANQT